jgi:hypothetical protein
MLTITSEKFGYAEITPSGDFEAGSYQSFDYLYTTGLYGIDDTGGIKVIFRLANDQSRIQFDDPKAPGYTTVVLPSHVKADVSYDPRGHKRPWYKVLRVKLVKGNLRQGDTIQIRFGDRRSGSPGIRMQTFCQNDFEFRTLVDIFSNQNYLPLPDSPKIRIVPGRPAHWIAVLPTLIDAGNTFRLSLKCEDEWGNPSDQIDATVNLKPSIPVAGLPEKVVFPPGKLSAVLDGLSVEKSESLSITLYDTDGELLAVSNPLRLLDKPTYKHFWGDLHGQSRETVGTNTADAYFKFARDLAFLDITGHQGNDFQITAGFWQHLDQLAAKFHEPGRFITLPGYEWSGNSGLGGDRNVYFASEGATIYRSSHALVPEEPDENPECYQADILFKALRKSRIPAVVFAHVGGRYADLSVGHDGRTEHAVEIHSAWGTFEWLLHQAFELGHRVGVVCHSDDHKCRPGASHPGASLFGAYGGLTCYLMEELNRDSLFEAIRRRHHYGTTGNRIYLDVHARFATPALIYPRDPLWFDVQTEKASKAIMGDIAQVFDTDISVSVEIESSVPIERVELYDTTTLLDTIRFYTAEDLQDRVRILWEGAEYKGRGRTVYWNGGLELHNNSINRFSPINFKNIEHLPTLLANKSLSWNSVTTGNFLGVDLWLDDPDVGTLSFQTNQLSFDLPISEVGMNDRVFEAGGLGKRVRIFRLPSEMKVKKYRFERPVSIRPHGDTRIYAKVIFEDGHVAWSSPMYFFKQPVTK